MSDDSELVEKVAKCIDLEEGYWQHFVEAAERIIPLISRQAKEEMLRSMIADIRANPDAFIYHVETWVANFAREHGLNIPNEEKEDART